MTFLGEGATGLISLSGRGISAFLISRRRYPNRNVRNKMFVTQNQLGNI